MSQEELRKNAIEYVHNNLNNIETLKFVVDVLEDLSTSLQYEMETPKDKCQFNRITTATLLLKELVKYE